MSDNQTHERLVENARTPPPNQLAPLRYLVAAHRILLWALH